MDGISLLEEIKKIDKETKVIVISNFPEKDTVFKLNKLGIKDFIVKPFTEERILNSIKKLLFIFVLLFSLFSINFSYSEKLNKEIKSATALTTIVSTETPDFTYREEKPISYNPTRAFLTAIFYLILIIIFIYVVVLILKVLFSRRGVVSLISPSLIKILESSFIAPHASIHIVEIVGKIFIIGVSERSISLLSEITEEENVSLIRQAKSSHPSFQKQLTDFISKFSHRDEKKESSNSTFKEGKEYLEEKLKQLKNLKEE